MKKKNIRRHAQKVRLTLEEKIKKRKNRDLTSTYRGNETRKERRTPKTYTGSDGNNGAAKQQHIKGRKKSHERKQKYQGIPSK